MNLSLDYDDTYTTDPEFWDVFLTNARHRGYNVYIVTMRFPDEPVHDKLAGNVSGIIYTSRRAKRPHLRELNIAIDIWIDDRPEFILFGSNDAALEELLQ